MKISQELHLISQMIEGIDTTPASQEAQAIMSEVDTSATVDVGDQQQVEYFFRGVKDSSEAVERYIRERNATMEIVIKDLEDLSVRLDQANKRLDNPLRLDFRIKERVAILTSNISNTFIIANATLLIALVILRVSYVHTSLQKHKKFIFKSTVFTGSVLCMASSIYLYRHNPYNWVRA